MKHQITAAIAGALFGLGLMFSGMTRPEKVKGFLDFFGDWDPTLAFVLGVAVPIYFVGFKLARLLMKTRSETPFAWLEPGRMTPRFFLGSAMFGVGWGMVGLCPGPALMALGGLSSGAGLFFIVLMGSIFAMDTVLNRWS